jgi:hypothetical protein
VGWTASPLARNDDRIPAWATNGFCGFGPDSKKFFGSFLQKRTACGARVCSGLPRVTDRHAQDGGGLWFDCLLIAMDNFAKASP